MAPSRAALQGAGCAEVRHLPGKAAEPAALSMLSGADVIPSPARPSSQRPRRQSFRNFSPSRRREGAFSGDGRRDRLAPREARFGFHEGIGTAAGLPRRCLSAVAARCPTDGEP